MHQIIFLHGLKTGGTSLRYMLLKQYGYAKIAPVPLGRSMTTQDYPVLRYVDPLEYQNYIQPRDVAPYGVVMSHYDWRIVERLPARQIITMLRHPVYQIKSLYQYMIRCQDFPEFQAGDFMDWLRGEGQAYLNGQTKTLSGHASPNLNVAIRNLEHERLSFGILEEFKASILYWNERFNWSLEIENRNRSENPVDLTPDEFNAVALLQSEDMQLYECAYELFSQTVLERV